MDQQLEEFIFEGIFYRPFHFPITPLKPLSRSPQAKSLPIDLAQKTTYLSWN